MTQDPADREEYVKINKIVKNQLKRNERTHQNISKISVEVAAAIRTLKNEKSTGPEVFLLNY